MVTLEEKIFGNSLGAFILYAKMADGTIVPLAAAVNGDGTYSLRCDTELTAAIDPTGLATSAKQPALEGTDKAKVSLYVKKTANGDTVLTLGKAADADSIPVALSTEALAALENITATLAAGTNSIGGTKDNGPQWTVTRTYSTSADMTTAADLSVAPASGQKIVADDILISSAVAMEFSIQEESAVTVFASVFIPANGTVQITLRDGLKLATADKKLQGKASVAGNVRITACYHSEA